MFIQLPRDPFFGGTVIEEYFNLDTVIYASFNVYPQRYKNLYAHLTLERSHGTIVERYYATEDAWNHVYQHLSEHTQNWLPFLPNPISPKGMLINPCHVLAIRFECDKTATSGIVAGIFIDLAHHKKAERLYQQKDLYHRERQQLQQILHISHERP